jgi:hypothetical protein
LYSRIRYERTNVNGAAEKHFTKNPDQYTRSLEFLAEEATQYSRRGIIILGGDFNAHLGDLQEHSDTHSIVPRASLSQHRHDRRGRFLFQLCDLLQLQIADRLGLPTRYPINQDTETPTCIDHVLVPIADAYRIKDYCVNTRYCEFSDHAAVEFKLQLHSDLQILLRSILNDLLWLDPSMISDSNPPTQVMKSKNRINTQDLLLALDNDESCQLRMTELIAKSTFVDIKDIFELWESAYDAANKTLEQDLDTRHMHANSAEARSAIIRKTLYHEQTRSLSTAALELPNDTDEYKANLKQQFHIRKQLTKANKLLTRLERLDNKQWVIHLEQSGNSSGLRRLLQQSQRQSSIPCHMYSSLHRYHSSMLSSIVTPRSSPSARSSQIEAYVRSVHPMEQQHRLKFQARFFNVDEQDAICQLDWSDTARHLDDLEISFAIRKLSTSSASGPDGVQVSFLKACARSQTAFTLLTRSLQHYWIAREYPPVDTLGKLVLLFKGKGSALEPSNYRGLTVEGIFTKLFSVVLHARLYLWAEFSGLLPSEQMGFRLGFRTLDAVISHVAANQTMKRAKHNVWNLYIDFMKAFDNVSRECLFDKLESLGLSGAMSTTIRHMYNSATVRLSFMSDPTFNIQTKAGVLQGDPLSPLLFLLYIADLPWFLKTTTTSASLYISLFADDLALTLESLDQMQHTAIQLLIYCELWGLTINWTKSKCMPFNASNNGPFVVLCGSRVEVVPTFKFLGIIINMKMSFSAHEKQLIRSANLFMREWLHWFEGFKDLISVSTAIWTLQEHLISRIGYGVELLFCTNKTVNDIDGIISRCLSAILGCRHYGVQSDCLYYDLQLIPYRFTIMRRQASYATHLATLPVSHTVRAILSKEKSFTRKLINRISSYNLPMQQLSPCAHDTFDQWILSPTDAHKLKLQLKQHTRTCFRTEHYQTVKANASNFLAGATVSTKLRTLSTFIQLPEDTARAPVTLISNICKRGQVMDFRTACPRLNIDSGRKTKYNPSASGIGQNCPRCFFDTGILTCESEEHFAIHCQSLSTTREPYLVKFERLQLPLTPTQGTTWLAELFRNPEKAVQDLLGDMLHSLYVARMAWESLWNEGFGTMAA